MLGYAQCSFFHSDKFHVKNLSLSWQDFVCIISNIRRYSPTVSGLFSFEINHFGIESFLALCWPLVLVGCHNWL